MALSAVGFIALLLLVGILRLIELRHSRSNQMRLRAMGAHEVSDPYFYEMVLFHIAVLVGAALEIVLLRRPLHPLLAISMICLFLLANAMRWWVIRTLGVCWTVRVMDSARIEVVTGGPFRFIRHPNYTAVYIEMLALPLIHTAWLTALAGAAAHLWVLSRRLAVEEPALMSNQTYLRSMADKPRFLPGLF